MTEFHLKGFLLCLAAAACGGFRWTLSQILTQKKELGLQNPIDAIFHLQPVMVIAMAPLLVGHGLLPFLTTDNLFAAPSFAILLPNSLKILAGAILAFALGLTEYLLVAKTSSLTLSLSGIIKELITMLVAEFVEGDKLTLINWAGFAICVSGIMVHTYSKYKRTSRDSSRTSPRGSPRDSPQYLHLENDNSPLLEMASGDDDDDVIYSK